MNWLDWQQQKELHDMSYFRYQRAMRTMELDMKIVKVAYDAAFALMLISLYQLFPERAEEIDNCFDIYCGMPIIHG